MRIHHRWQIDAIAVLFAGLLTVSLAARVRAQQPTSSVTANASAADSEPAQKAPPNLADVDIDALLDHRPPEPPTEAPSLATRLLDDTLDAIAAAEPEGGWGELLMQAEKAFARLLDSAERHLPDSSSRE